MAVCKRGWRQSVVGGETCGRVRTVTLPPRPALCLRHTTPPKVVCVGTSSLERRVVLRATRVSKREENEAKKWGECTDGRRAEVLTTSTCSTARTSAIQSVAPSVFVGSFSVSLSPSVRASAPTVRVDVQTTILHTFNSLASSSAVSFVHRSPAREARRAKVLHLHKCGGVQRV